MLIADNYTFTYVSGSLTINEVLEVGIEEVIRIYPNPATDYILIESSSAAKVEIYDMRGLKSIESDQVYEQIDLSQLGRGVYLIRLLNKYGEEIHTQRIIKN